jgi:uncharacterized protein (DUF433 family)
LRKLVFADAQSKLKTVAGGAFVVAPKGVIVRDPDVLGGTPVFRGTRVPFQALLDYIEGGQTIDDFLDDFPTVGREMAIDALEHAKSLVVSHL